MRKWTVDRKENAMKWQEMTAIQWEVIDGSVAQSTANAVTSELCILEHCSLYNVSSSSISLRTSSTRRKDLKLDKNLLNKLICYYLILALNQGPRYQDSRSEWNWVWRGVKETDTPWRCATKKEPRWPQSEGRGKAMGGGGGKSSRRKVNKRHCRSMEERLMNRQLLQNYLL